MTRVVEEGRGRRDEVRWWGDSVPLWALSVRSDWTGWDLTAGSWQPERDRHPAVNHAWPLGGGNDLIRARLRWTPAETDGRFADKTWPTLRDEQSLADLLQAKRNESQKITNSRVNQWRKLCRLWLGERPSIRAGRYCKKYYHDYFFDIDRYRY